MENQAVYGHAKIVTSPEFSALRLPVAVLCQSSHMDRPAVKMQIGPPRALRAFGLVMLPLARVERSKPSMVRKNRRGEGANHCTLSGPRRVSHSEGDYLMKNPAKQTGLLSVRIAELFNGPSALLALRYYF